MSLASVVKRCGRALGLVAVACALLVGAPNGVRAAEDALPVLTQPVNDFAHVVDAQSAKAIDTMSRALKAASGDVVVVATIPTFEPYGDIREYAVKLFANGGRGIGEKGKDNGVLILVALKERKVWIEVGYGIEPFVTDGFAGETVREVIVPAFKSGQYGRGLQAGAGRIIQRIADGRKVSLQGVRIPTERRHQTRTPTPLWVIILIFIVVLLLSRIGGGPGSGITPWGGRRGGWSGWSSGVGGFGGGGGGGFGGGFGGFSGGGSGGGGGGGSW